jgi:hypothetical protein
MPEREVMTGPVVVRCPRVRDRVGKGAERIRFSSAILPPYARRSKSTRDGALGFWKAVEEVWPKTRGQRWCVLKTANVLTKQTKSHQPKAKRALQEI